MVFCKLQVVFFKGGDRGVSAPLLFFKTTGQVFDPKKIFDELCNSRNCLGNVDMNLENILQNFI